MYLEKNYQLSVINIDQSIAVLRKVGIEALANGTGIAFTIPETKKTEIIKLLNKESIIIYDIEEVI